MKACPLCRGRGYYDRWSVSRQGVRGLFNQQRALRIVHQDEHQPVGGPNDAGELVDVAPKGCPYWIPGAVVVFAQAPVVIRAASVEPHSIRFAERSACAECNRRRQAFANNEALDVRLAEHESKRERNKALNRATKNIRWIKDLIVKLDRAAVATAPDDGELLGEDDPHHPREARAELAQLGACVEADDPLESKE